MTTVAETSRLLLREFGADDVDELAALVADNEQMAFYPRPKTREEAADWIDWNRRLYDEYGFGTWFLALRSSTRFVGYCGIRPLALQGASEFELAWHTKKASWNHGIATEAATAARDLACGCFGLRRLVAVIRPDHQASRRVAEKIGMRAERTTIVDGDYPAVIYATSPPGSPR